MAVWLSGWVVWWPDAWMPGVLLCKKLGGMAACWVVECSDGVLACLAVWMGAGLWVVWCESWLAGNMVGCLVGWLVCLLI